MARRVLMESGGSRVYASIEEAAADLGRSSSAVSRAIKDGLMRWRDRVWAIRLRDGGEWRIGVLDSRNLAYLEIGSGKRIAKGAVAEVKDITEVW